MDDFFDDDGRALIVIEDMNKGKVLAAYWEETEESLTYKELYLLNKNERYWIKQEYFFWRMFGNGYL